MMVTSPHHLYLSAPFPCLKPNMSCSAGCRAHHWALPLKHHHIKAMCHPTSCIRCFSPHEASLRLFTHPVSLSAISTILPMFKHQGFFSLLFYCSSLKRGSESAMRTSILYLPYIAFKQSLSMFFFSFLLQLTISTNSKLW